MNASLRKLLSGVIDYAGLFPPAKLPLDQAIRNYLRYLAGPDAWMLGGFVVPATALESLAPYHGELTATFVPARFAVLGRGGASHEAVLEGLAEDRQVMQRFREAGRFAADVLELRGPLDSETAADAAQAAGGVAAVFYEISFAGDWRPWLTAVASALAWFNASQAERRAGLKLRTGGLEASAFPTVEEVAFVLHACRDAGVPLKFTAGLHHPVRRFDAGLRCYMHGFVNVFVAGVLAHARRLDEEALRAVLANEDPPGFVFGDDGLSWRDLRASGEEIAAARRDFVTSFGSCSFDEPRDELRALGWL
jgi:hypothetical protein